MSAADTKPKKPRGGQVKAQDVKQKRRQITLDDAGVAQAKRLGAGNISEGIRIALLRTLPPA